MIRNSKLLRVVQVDQRFSLGVIKVRQCVMHQCELEETTALDLVDQLCPKGHRQ